MPVHKLRIVVTLTCILVTLITGAVVSYSLGPDARDRRALHREEAGGMIVVDGTLLEFGHDPLEIST
jgi:hypothetical protein